MSDIAFHLFVNEQNDISYLMDEEALVGAEMMHMVGYMSNNPYKIQFNKPNTEEFLQRSLQNGYAVQLLDEDHNILSVASPGNQISVQDALNLPVTQQTTIMIMLKDVSYYALIINCFSMTIGYFQFTDDDSFNHLQSFLIYNNVKELMYPVNDPQLERICQEYQVKLVKVAKSSFISYDDDKLPFEENYKKCAGCAIQECHIDLSLFTIEPYLSDTFLKLDIFAMRALHVFSSQNDTNSIYGVLNHCKTQMGKRLLKIWLQQPLNNAESISNRLDIVSSFQSCNVNSLGLDLFPDITRFARKLLISSINLNEFWSFKDIMDQTHAVVSNLQHCNEHIQACFLVLLQDILKETHSFYQCIVDNIIYHPHLHTYQINPSSLASLKQLDAEMTIIKSEMENVFQSVKQQTTDKLTLEKHTKHGYCLRVPKSKSNLVKKYKSIIELATLKNQSFFTTVELQQHTRALNELQNQFDEAAIEIMTTLKQIGKEYAPLFLQLSEVLAQMDVLSSFAIASTMYNYTRPVIEQSFKIENCRHPCVELQPDITFIANNCHMDDIHVQIITGFNTGGKSTYLRTVGVCALMAHIGCFVPCSNCTIPLLDGIFCRVGAGDSLIRGKSTFMNEMLEASGILKAATKNSLVLVDELGRGTSHSDGFGLAWAILEHLTEIGCWTLFATHYHELTQLGQENTRISCKKVDMAIVKDSIVPCYTIVDGIAHHSFGIKVAEMAGFPSQVIEDAKTIQSALQ